MSCWMFTKAVSGFIDLPVGLKLYSSSSSQMKRSSICSQLELTPSAKAQTDLVSVCFYTFASPLPPSSYLSRTAGVRKKER